MTRWFHCSMTETVYYLQQWSPTNILEFSHFSWFNKSELTIQISPPLEEISWVGHISGALKSFASTDAMHVGTILQCVDIQWTNKVLYKCNVVLSINRWYYSTFATPCLGRCITAGKENVQGRGTPKWERMQICAASKRKSHQISVDERNIRTS